MLASGADIKIGAYEFLLDGSQGLPYLYTPESLYSDSQEIQGIEGAKTANPNVLVWSVDNFVDGAETKFFDEDVPNSYWYGRVNPRVAGQLRPTPTTANTNVTQTATLAATQEVFFNAVAGRLWMGCGRDVWYSTDNGATWTQHGAPAALFGAGYTINGMTDDGNYVWVTASNGSTRQMVRIDSTTASTTAVSDVTTAIRALGLGRIEGKVYAWTGGHLYEYNSQDTLPLTHRSVPSGTLASNIVHQPHAATPAGTYLTDFYGGIASTDTSVVYFLAASGRTIVYEFKYNAATNVFAGRKIWEPPTGFTATHIAHSMGIIYLVGSYGNEVALLSLSLQNRDSYILTYVGQVYGSEAAATLNPRFLTGSYGAQIVLGVDDGTTNYVFVYDAESDSLSELDQQTLASVGTMKAAFTSGNRRVVGEHLGTSTTLRTQRWSDDNASTTNGWTWISSAHHFRFPYDEKLLTRIQVLQDPAQTDGTITVEYRLDENSGLSQIITLTNFSGTDSFFLSYDGTEGPTQFVRGTNATAAAIQAALRTDTGDTGLTVSGTTDAGPFTVTFTSTFDYGVLSVTNAVGCTGSVSQEESWITTDEAGAAMTTTAGVKYTSFQISGDTVSRKFHTLRLRLTGASGARLFNVTAFSYLNPYQEKWAVRVRIDDEVAALNSRPTSRQVSAQDLAGYIRTLTTNRNSVAFRDGWRYKKRSDTENTGFSEHTVVLEFPAGSGIQLVRQPGSDQVFGFADLILRSIRPN